MPIIYFNTNCPKLYNFSLNNFLKSRFKGKSFLSEPGHHRRKLLFLLLKMFVSKSKVSSLRPTFTVGVVRVLLAEGVEEGPGADGDAEGVGGGKLLVDNTCIDNVENYLQLILSCHACSTSS